MDDPRLREILRLLEPPAGERLWYGGAGVLGCLRGVTPSQAAWKPGARPHSIWELTLHLAYWKYAVARRLTDAPRNAFPRAPSNWPRVPLPAGAAQWTADRALLRAEHERLVEAVRGFDPRRLDETPAAGGRYRFADLMVGIASHDLYHVGQIQLLKRLHRSRPGTRAR